MRNKITSGALEAFAHCKTKFHLKLLGVSGQATDYETVTKAQRQAAEKSAINHLRRTHTILDKVPTDNIPPKGTLYFVKGSCQEDNDFSVQVDGVELKPNNHERFSLVPTVFADSLTAKSSLLFFLQTYGLLLSKAHKVSIPQGVIWIGEYEKSTVSLRTDGRKFSSRLQELLLSKELPSPPPLLLNDHCQIYEFRSRCREQATQEGNLSLLRGMTAKEIAKYNAKGIFNINQLSYTFRFKRPPKRSQKQTGPHYFSLQAQAIREDKVLVHGSTAFNINKPRIYFDIESAPHRNGAYLIGAIVELNKSHRYYCYWADGELDTSTIFADFLRLLDAYSTPALIHYGSFETAVLRRVKSKLPEALSESVERAIARSVNILSFIRCRVYFPTFSNSLKDIAGYLGMKWSAPNSFGIQSLAWREKWLESGELFWKNQLLQYNKEDCEALRLVTEFLDKLHSSPTDIAASKNLAVAFTKDLPRSASKRPIFGTATFFLPDFEVINRCGHFDYQRDRVSARFPGRRKKNTSLLKIRRRRKLKVNKVQHIAARKCQKCRSRNILPVRRLARQIIDLKFSPYGVKKWVVR